MHYQITEISKILKCCVYFCYAVHWLLAPWLILARESIYHLFHCIPWLTCLGLGQLLQIEEGGVLIESMDGCFGLVRKMSAGANLFQPRHCGTFFAEQDSVDKFVEDYGKKADEAPTVSSHTSH